ncbi:hypothetical protein OG909_14860 [Streptomyces sp. NBC_01754]|uniref:hypothetical protein n=1 Tax=Streptomyces sp. NBC_01754 TaxID=2975930 RepID=UPI002DDC2AA1|nr:hypothetical protein [Streptomyces sp. NBC_01754]WSC93461.1 hypothetical protein OG909_14860 [Streptomyces sp. NBC_01754]
MRVPIPYVAARSSDLAPLESDLCVEVPRNGLPRLAYVHSRAGDRDAHGNLWARMTGGEGGTVLYHSMHPTRQRECMEKLLCQVCGKPARTATGTLFIDWLEDDSPPAWPEGVVTGMPPVCRLCAPTSLRHCPVLRNDVEPAVLLVRKSVVCGVSGTIYRVKGQLEGWIPSEEDVYSSYTRPGTPACSPNASTAS